MNDDLKILSDQIRSLLIVMEKVLPAVKWETLPADTREWADLAIEEAEETIGEADDCAAGACQWRG